MAKFASDADFAAFDGGSGAPNDIPTQFEALEKVAEDLKALWISHEQEGVPGGGNNYVSVWYIGTATIKKFFRITVTGSGLVLEYNSALSDASPVWAERLALGAITDQVVGKFKADADMDLDGNAITNVGNVDGVDVSTHAARHAPGGADAVAVGTPVPVAAANAAGSASSLARSDHEHQGLLRWLLNAAGPKFGDLDLTDDGTVLQWSNPSGNQAKLTFGLKRTYQDNEALGADQNVTQAAGETDLTSLNGISIDGADGTRKFKIEGMVKIKQSGQAEVSTARLYVDANGVSSGGTLRDTNVGTVGTVAGQGDGIYVYWEGVPPNNGKMGISLQTSVTDIDVAANTGYFSWLKAEEVRES